MFTTRAAAPRVLARHATLRPFSTSRPLARLDLSYDLHEPPKGSATSPSENAPIIILHGLFGSKRNNRSISKYGLFWAPCSGGVCADGLLGNLRAT